MTTITILGMPILLALLGFHSRLRATVAATAHWAALPALAWAIWNPPDATVDIPGLFFGLRLGLDDTGRAFIPVVATLWITAGMAARSSGLPGINFYRFCPVYLGTLTGTLGLFMAQDLPTFALFHALMTFGVYGLIVCEHRPAAHRAGLTYLIPAVISETLLLEAILLISFITSGQDMANIPPAVAASPERHMIIGLLLIGLGIRVGIPPFHVWIPRAYTAAPAAVGSLLSGSMVMAGFLGWIRLLPLGEMAGPEWGLACIVAGTLALFYGFAVGLTQQTPGAILAYALIAQAGLLTAGIGMGFAIPNLWVGIDRWLMFYTLHLALIMGTLFLGLDIVRQATRLKRPQQLGILLGLIVPALSLAGAPFGSGISARAIFETTAPATTLEIPLNWLPTIAGFGTTLLMGRFLIAVRQLLSDKKIPPPHRVPAGTWMPWAVLLIGVGILAWGMHGELAVKAGSLLNSPAGIWGSLWPILLGGFVGWGLKQASPRFHALSIPPGDLVVGIEWLYRRILTKWTGFNRKAWASWGGPSMIWSFLRTSGSWLFLAIGKVEEQIGHWTILGTSFLFLATLLFFLLFAG